MCANLGPAAPNFDETISTLRYADRAKQIKNKPVSQEHKRAHSPTQLQYEAAPGLLSRSLSRERSRGLIMKPLLAGCHSRATTVGAALIARPRAICMLDV